jgi:ribonuclease D
VAEVAAEIERAGSFAFDLEFVSEGRYVPDLTLIQVAWGDPDEPQVVAVDTLAADPRPLLAPLADPAVETVLHAVQGDLSLLSQRFGAAGGGVIDTQLAAAFLGLGDQVGYAALVEQVLGVALDKASQFTDWARRPLTPEQLRYALDDVRYLPPLWRELSARLAERGRLDWVREESAALAEAAARRAPPEEAYLRFRAWDRLPPRAVGALRAAAAWRERRALATNTPPRWILQDGALLEAARRLPRQPAELAEIQGIGRSTVRKVGSELIEALHQGASDPPPATSGRRQDKRARKLAKQLAELVGERSEELVIAQRLLATRADLEALVQWWLDGGPEAEPGAPRPAPLTGWRREVVGDALLAELGAAETG